MSMLRLLRGVISAGISPDPGPKPDPEERVRVATCVILLSVAHSDEEYTDEERRHLTATMRSRFELEEQDAAELIAASETARRESNDIWQFTHSINEFCTIAEKRQIMEEVWRMVCADGMLDAHEEHLVRSLGKLLNLTHEEVIQAKVKIFDEFRSR